MSEPPKFTLKNVSLDVYNGVIFLTTNPNAKIVLYPVLVCLASIITKTIIHNIKYTEIDYRTYLQQIELIEDFNQLDYLKIFGDSGPIVYPGGHVFIYSWIKYLTQGSIEQAQSIFGYLFVTCVVFSCLIYSYVQDLQPWVIFLFLLSKRTLSIFVLRLFNDCWVSLCILGTIILFQQANQEPALRTLFCVLAADLYSIGISIKMNSLLYLPGFVIVLYFLQNESLIKTLLILTIIPIVQVFMGWKFLLIFYNDKVSNMIRWNYITQAFNFKRKFIYYWSVNWKFISEEVFQSDVFHKLLLVLHITVLIVFIFGKFLNPKVTNKSRLQLFKDMFMVKSSSSSKFLDPKVGPQLIFYVFAITNLIGVVFARSLHYQFLSWYNFQLPGLIYLSCNNIFIGTAIWFLHEWCWLVFPSTKYSSGLLIIILTTLITMSYFNFDKLVCNKEIEEKKNV